VTNFIGEKSGLVYLVGAGPGDPDLLTVGGKRALEQCDVVFYDALTHPKLLSYCKMSCEKIFVGKRATQHFVVQQDTNTLLIEAAQAGKVVVRLKGGDPFIFGRGGEEAEILREAGINFVIIPGISSAIAAPAYAGIPVTHRDASSSFAVITGHERADNRESGTREAGKAEGRRRWDRIAHAADTIIFLMGVDSLGEITARLVENGRTPDTLVAVIQWGTWAKQRTVTGTLATIESIVKGAGITAPAVTVVGDVVRYHDTLNWFDNRPLHGRRIVVTRAREQASDLVEMLRLLGADPIEFPTIQIIAPTDNYAALDAFLGGERPTGWVFFTSANGVSHTFDRLNSAAGRDARFFANAKIAAIGPATADALKLRGICSDFVPTEFVAEGVLKAFSEPVTGQNMTILRAEEGRDVLPDELQKRGANVRLIPVYKTTVIANDASGTPVIGGDFGDVDAITFTSSSTVKNFVQAMGETTLPVSTRLVCIGPATAATCTELLRTPDAVADTYTLDGLVESLQMLLQKT
jgi:uroporphyrinogen III methyltransferase / synthase